MARGEVPDRIEEAIRLGRITALRKPDGGVRGIVVGDFLHRLVARTIAKQIAKQVEVAPAPWQYVLTTRAGCECVAHVLQHLTDGDAQATILSVDGIGAFDLVSRNAMLQGLMSIEDGGKVLPFVKTFYGQPSNFIWEDETGDVHDIPQEEGVDQSDPLMPLLFCLAQHVALRAVADQMEEGEHLSAFLDDLYIVCHPDRVGEIHSILQRELFRHAHISIHLGKTTIWNTSGDEPEACARLQAAASCGGPVSCGLERGSHHTLPVSSQGVKILGSPVGHPGFVSAQLQVKSDSHSVLLDRIPAVEDLQAAWLLRLFCAQAKANFLLWSVHPDSTLQYATRHDNHCWQCLCQI